MSLKRAYGRRNTYSRTDDIKLIQSFVDSDGMYFVEEKNRINLFQFEHIDSDGVTIPEGVTKFAGGATVITGARYRYQMINQFNPGPTTTFEKCILADQTAQIIVNGTGWSDGTLAGYGDSTWDKTNGFWIYRPDVNQNAAIVESSSDFTWNTKINVYETGKTHGSVAVGVIVNETPVRFTIKADQTIENQFVFGWADTKDSELVTCVEDSELHTAGRVIHVYNGSYTDFTIKEEKTVRVWAVGAGGSGGGKVETSPVAPGSGGGGGAFIEATAVLTPGTYRLYSGLLGERQIERIGGKSALVKLGDSETIIYAGGGMAGDAGWGIQGGAGGTFKVSPNFKCTIVQGRSGGEGGAAADSEGLSGSVGSPPSDGLRSSFVAYSGVAVTTEANDRYMCGGGAGGSDVSTRVDGGAWGGGDGGSTSNYAGGYATNNEPLAWGFGGGGGGQSRITLSEKTRGGGGGSKGAIVMRFET